MYKTIVVPQEGTEDALDWDRLWWIDTKEQGRQLMTLRVLVGNLIQEAHIAGSMSTKGTGLNLSKEERAEQYCKDKGLRI
jgi:hypothetical protein